MEIELHRFGSDNPQNDAYQIQQHQRLHVLALLAPASPCAPRHRQQAEPHGHRIADQHHPALRAVGFLVKIPDRAAVADPLPPCALIGVRFEHLRLQGEHILVQIDQTGRIARRHAPVEEWPERQRIDRQRQQPKPDARFPQRNPCHRPAAGRTDKAAALCLPARGEEGEAGQDGDRDCVPFARHRAAQSHAARRKSPAACLILSHGTCEHPQGDHQKADHEHIEHGDAGVNEQQVIGADEQAGQQAGGAGLAGEPRGPHRREQGERSEGNARQAPACGIVAEHPYAQRYQLLGERWVLQIGGEAQFEHRARGGQIMHLVEIWLARHANPHQRQRAENQRGYGVEDKRIAGMVWRGAHKECNALVAPARKGNWQTPRTPLTLHPL